jgi:hypothetical protein
MPSVLRFVVLLPCLVMTLAATGNVSGQSTEHRVRFVPRVGNAPVQDARVCLFAGVYSPNPVITMGQTDRVDCFDERDAIAIPPGLWHAYTYVGTRLISAQPDILIYEGHEDTYREVDVELESAGVLDFADLQSRLGENEHLGVWIANTALPTLPSIIRPLPRGSNHLVVPAGETLFPVVLNEGALVSVGDAVTVRPEETRRLRPWSQSGTTLVAWVKMDPENSPVSATTELSAPHVVYRTSAGAEYEPVFMRDGPSFELDLVIFRNVPKGSGKVIFSGETWGDKRSR